MDQIKYYSKTMVVLRESLDLFILKDGLLSCMTFSKRK